MLALSPDLIEDFTFFELIQLHKCINVYLVNPI